MCVHSHFITPQKPDGTVLLMVSKHKRAARLGSLPSALKGTLNRSKSTRAVRGQGQRGCLVQSPIHTAGADTSVGYLRPLLCSDVEGVSDRTLLGVLHAPPDKLGVDLLLHEHPGGGRAALTLVEEHSLMGALHCQVHWREGGGRSERKRLSR